MKPNYTPGKEDIFEACLVLIEKEGWKGFSFDKVSKTTAIPLHLIQEHFSSPPDIMKHLFCKIDGDVLKNLNPDEDLSPRDVLFDILMARFDAALPYKPILKSFWSEWIFSPEEAPSLLFQGFSSMAWMLEAAHLNPRGIKGMLRIQGLTTLYLLTLNTWLGDDSPDLAKTMAFLDKGLTRLEKMATFLNSF